MFKLRYVHVSLQCFIDFLQDCYFPAFTFTHHLKFLTSSGTSSSTVAFSVINNIFRRLDPVIERVSLYIESRRNFAAFLVDFLICSRKDRNLFSSVNLMCLIPLSGSISLLCVSLGRFIMSLMDTFHVLSICTVSLEKRYHKQDPDRWVL